MTWLRRNFKVSTTKCNTNVLKNCKVTSATHSALKSLVPHADMRFQRQISAKAKLLFRTQKNRIKMALRRTSFAKPAEPHKMLTLISFVA